MTKSRTSGRRVGGIGIAFAIVLASQPAPAQDADLATVAALERTLIQAIQRAESSVVSIARIKNAPRSPSADRFGLDRNRFRHDLPRLDTDRPGSSDFIPNEFGSGILIAPLPESDKRFILTNQHVVKGGPVVGASQRASDSRLYVRFSNRRGYYAEIFAADPRSDLAVLTVDQEALNVPGSSLKPIQLGNASDVHKGQIVLTLGNPYAVARDGSASAGWGIVSNIARRPQPMESTLIDPQARADDTMLHLGTLLQIDTRLNLGTSGGAVVNLKGELIGVTTALAALEGYETSVGYALPLDDATRRIIETLARGQEVEYGFLGVSPEDVLPEELQRLSGRFQQVSAVGLLRVFPNSPASLGGLMAADVVLAVNGQPVYDRYDLMRLVSELGPAAEAHLTVWRERTGENLDLTVTLGKWPVVNEEQIIAPNPRHPPWRGLTIDYPTGRRKFLPQPIHRLPNGVLVTTVAAQSPAEQAGLQPGDFISRVDQTPVRTPDEFYRSVRNTEQNEVTLTLSDGRQVTIPK